MSESGSMSLLMTAVAGLLAVVAVATTALSLAYSARVQASTAADAAALAAAPATYPGVGPGSPMQAASSLAAANGARLVSCLCAVDRSPRARVVSVVTAVPVELPLFGRLEVTATASAEFDPSVWHGP